MHCGSPSPVVDTLYLDQRVGQSILTVDFVKLFQSDVGRVANIRSILDTLAIPSHEQAELGNQVFNCISNKYFVAFTPTWYIFVKMHSLSYNLSLFGIMEQRSTLWNCCLCKFYHSNINIYVFIYHKIYETISLKCS